MIKLGMIGCGSMANYHAESIAKMENVQVVVCCDLLADKAAALADTFGCKHCTDHNEAYPQVDAVWVCTEPFNRVEIVCAAAAAGKHIFTEKPIALNLADADTMIAAARAAGVKYMLGYCLRFWQPYKMMREIFASGELGELVNCWTRRYMPTDMRPHWYGKQELSGGVVLDFGSHDLDWLMTIGGPVKTVFGKTFRIREGIQADEHSQCMLVFANGGMAASDVTWWEAVAESSLGVVGTLGSLIVGRDGVLVKKLVGQDEEEIDVASAMDIDMSGNLGQRDDDGRIHRVMTRDETIQEHFFRCIDQDTQPITDAQIGRDVLELVIAVRQSAELGKSVDL